MNRRSLLRAAPPLFVVGLAGCAAPLTHYYRLAALDGGLVRTVPGRAGPFGVGVRSIGIPGYLDRDGIAKPSGAYHFDSYSNDLWAEPLADLLQSALVQELSQRLPAATVAGSDVIGAPRDLLVDVNVLRFDPDSNGQITLSAQIAVQGSDRKALLIQNYQTALTSGGSTVTDLVATMSVMWAALADQAAAMIAQSWMNLPPAS